MKDKMNDSFAKGINQFGTLSVRKHPKKDVTIYENQPDNKFAITVRPLGERLVESAATGLPTMAAVNKWLIEHGIDMSEGVKFSSEVPCGKCGRTLDDIIKNPPVLPGVPDVPEVSGTRPYVPGETKVPESPYSVVYHARSLKQRVPHALTVTHNPSGVSVKYSLRNFDKALAAHTLLSKADVKHIRSSIKKSGWRRSKRGALYRPSKTGKKIYKRK